MKLVRVAADRWNFETGPGEYVSPIGGNVLDDQHPAQGTMWDRFDAADADRRLGLMADIGLNCLRLPLGVNHVYDPATRTLRAQGLRHWDAFIALAERRGDYLMPVGGYIGGNDWFDVARLADSGEQLDHDCAFWSLFTAHYRDHPAVWAWDLRNELLFDSKPHNLQPGSADEQRLATQLLEHWPAFLEARYGSVAAMNRAYGNAAFGNFADVPASVRFEEAPFSLRHADVRDYLNERGFHWCKRQVDAIRAADPSHMVCQGNNTWLSPDQDLWLANGFHNHAVHELFDFVTHHPYPALQPLVRGDVFDHPDAMDFWLSACVGMSRLDHYHKPVVIQEFGWYGGGESRFLCPLPFRSEQEHADYTRRLIDTLAPHANGFVNWPTFDMPAAADISNHGGIFTHHGQPKALTAVYRDAAATLKHRRHTRAPATTTLQWSKLGLFTSRPCQDALWDRVHELIAAGEVPDVRIV